MRRISIEEAAKMLKGRTKGARWDAPVDGISTDSRSTRHNDLFFALVGENCDGHQFVKYALEKEAAAAVVRNEWYQAEQPETGSYILVDDPLLALERMGALNRMRYEIPVVAITGSMGKTTTREMLNSILRSRLHALVSPANFNTEIGVPITLMDLEPGHDAAVIEMAMRGRGQITDLCAIAKPTAAIITNVGLVHLELLGSRENIAEAKAEVLECLPGQAWSVLNVDDDFFEFLNGKAPGPVITFGRSENAQYRGDDIRLGTDGCASFTLHARGNSIPVHLRVPGEFHVMNALAAAAAGARFGVPMEKIAQSLMEYDGFDKRAVVKQALGGWKVFDDTYNASPDAACGALDSLAAMECMGRKIVVLGDMRELGDLTEIGHQSVGVKVAQVSPDVLVTVGKDSLIIQQAALRSGYGGETVHFDDNDGAADYLVSLIHKGDLALVKGSRALRMERIVERLVR